MKEPKCSSKCPDMVLCAKCGEKQCLMAIEGKMCSIEHRLTIIKGKGLCCHKCTTFYINNLGRR